MFGLLLRWYLLLDVACSYRRPRGWWCSRHGAHMGPCALRPSWWNILARLKGL